MEPGLSLYMTLDDHEVAVDLCVSTVPVSCQRFGINSNDNNLDMMRMTGIAIVDGFGNLDAGLRPGVRPEAGGG